MDEDCIESDERALMLFRRLREYVRLLKTGSHVVQWNSTERMFSLRFLRVNRTFDAFSLDGKEVYPFSSISDIVPIDNIQEDIISEFKTAGKSIEIPSRMMEIEFEDSEDSLLLVFSDIKSFDVLYNGLAFLSGEPEWRDSTTRALMHHSTSLSSPPSDQFHVPSSLRSADDLNASTKSSKLDEPEVQRVVRMKNSMIRELCDVISSLLSEEQQSMCK